MTIKIDTLLAVMLVFMGCNFPSQKLNFSSSNIQVGSNPASVESSDFNGDGFPDILVANTGDSSVTILTGNKTGLPAAGTVASFFASHVPNDLDCADFNGDGNVDVLIANHEKKFMTLLLGNGKGSLRESPNSPLRVNVRPHVHGVASADFNRDGYRDCVTDSWGTNEIVILSGTQHGIFTNPVLYKTGDHPYQRVRVADFNKDGAADIVTTNLESNNCTILLNDGKGNFKQGGDFSWACGDAPFGVAVGDLNADGNPDLAIINSTSLSNRPGKDGLFILMGDGTGRFKPLAPRGFNTGVGPSRVAMGDINGDGIQDIAVANYRDNTVSLYIFGKDLTPEFYTLKTGKYADGVVIADTDRDGKGEVFIGNNGENYITVVRVIP
jgi:FG-GAP-like repeat/FG-GAP repeat